MLSQTTDSGSNNKTMAREMQKQFQALDLTSERPWDPETMHAFCFCHKLALIVNAGLAALGLKSPPPRSLKTSLRGNLPSIGESIEEEEETTRPTPPCTSKNHNDAQNFPQSKRLDVDNLENFENLFEEIPNHVDGSPRQESGSDSKLQDEEDWDLANQEEDSNPVFDLGKNLGPSHCMNSNKLACTFDKLRLL